MSGDEGQLRAMAQALARIARAAALRLPREVVDDAAQDAWARWLDACGGEDWDGSPAEPFAFLVGCFHHACADAVRAHRRRQRLHSLAADASGEPIDVADATGAHASGGGGHRTAPRSGRATGARRTASGRRRAVDRRQDRRRRLARGGRGSRDGQGGDRADATKNRQISVRGRRAQTPTPSAGRRSVMGTGRVLRLSGHRELLRPIPSEVP